MIASSFDESNCILNPPEGMSPEECNVLSVCKGMIGDMPVVISCWKCTKEELEEINRTGRVWLMIMGETMPPAHIQGIKPVIQL
jgi:hypothetical protein